MDPVFPFCYPAPTAFYLTAYMVTLLVHLVFMQYVLAGSAYLVFGRFLNRSLSFRRTPQPDTAAVDTQPDPIHETLRDWLPFATSAAITAGVAPLLFLQILYRKSFYTANLLLFHRWMAIVPVLIVGFYLLYLLKTERIRRGPAWRESAVALAALACFGFTAWSWSENHLLSLDSKSWAEVYQRGELFHHTPGAYLRTLGWFLSSFPTMLLLVGWQIHCHRSYNINSSPPIIRKLAAIAILSVMAGIISLLSTFPVRISISATGEVDTSNMARSMRFDFLMLIGLTFQVLGWIFLAFRNSIRTSLLLVCTFGHLALLVAIVAIRELGRVAIIDMAELAQSHADAFRIAGLPLFLLFLFVNAALVAWCIRIARRARNATNSR
ncbi:MAG: hypothetical protein HZA51_01770 [Planctomycetes bacterium]|nr:hypothetical protein [Planctomycetota bacterium]